MALISQFLSMKSQLQWPAWRKSRHKIIRSWIAPDTHENSSRSPGFSNLDPRSPADRKPCFPSSFLFHLLTLKKWERPHVKLKHVKEKVRHYGADARAKRARSLTCISYMFEFRNDLFKQESKIQTSICHKITRVPYMEPGVILQRTHF